MGFWTRRCVTVILALALCAVFAHGQEKQPPLKDTELLALVAGNVLSENIVYHLSTRGVAFQPTESYRALLSEAGADAAVLAALSEASVHAEANPAGKAQSPELLQHLAATGKLLRAGNYENATQEADAALQAGGGPCAAFVMGEVLRQQEQWAMSAAVYQRILEQDPNFPEAHTKFSYLQYRLGDADEGIRQAKAALDLTPNNAEAHKNAGLAYEIARKFDAGVSEYRMALHIKPDYEVVIYDLGNLYRAEGDDDDAISEYKKAIALKPDDVGAHGNMGIAYHEKKDYLSAVREYREAIRLDPNALDLRQNLGSALISAGMNSEAIIEFSQLETLAPNWPLCHICMSAALQNTGDLKGAEQELNTAASMDPSDAEPHIRLGEIRETQQLNDAALEEYRTALKLDPDSERAHLLSGRVYLATKNYAAAGQELKRAENLDASDVLAHELNGKVLIASGRPEPAIDEFKQALALDPKQLQVEVELASIYEKKGDWATAIELYRKAAAADASIDLRTRVVRISDIHPQDEYKTAQLRLADYIKKLKDSGKSTEAAALEASVSNAAASYGISDQLNTLMQAGFEAIKKQQGEEAFKDYEQAVELAEKMQPHDQRLATALDYLGMAYGGVQQDTAKADECFSRELKVVEELHGSQSPFTAQPLQSLGTSAIYQKNYPAAVKYYTAALEADERGFGQDSTQAAQVLVSLAQVFTLQQQYDKAEPYLIRSVKIYENAPVRDDGMMLIPLSSLTNLYENWGKPEKAEPCEEKVAAAIGRLFGPDSHRLVPVLTMQAKSLRSLGRNAEAAAIEKRIQTIQLSASN